MIKLAPSILAADFANLGEAVSRSEKAGCEYLHIDVMDGHFVPNISIGPVIVKAIRPLSKQFFDVHLMIEEPICYINEFVAAGADSITIHQEACQNIEETIDAIKQHGIKVGMSIKPDTSVEVLRPYIKSLDMVLIMSVNPGFGGQSFMPIALEHIAAVKQMIIESDTICDIEVDGGIYQHNVMPVLEAGANVIVGGTSVFQGKTIEENVALYRDLFEQYNVLE